MGRAGIHKRVKPKLRLIRLSDGRSGHDRQSLALTGALSRALAEHAVEGVVEADLPAPRSPPHLTQLLIRAGIWRRPDDVQTLPPGPTLLIGCGSRCARLSRLLRQRDPGHIRTVQILDPRRRRQDYDVLIIPLHDQVQGENIINFSGSLHPVDNDWLHRAAQLWSPAWADLPAPRLGLLIGGGRTLHRQWRQLKPLLAQRLAGGGSLLLSFSRRTPARAVAIIGAEASDWPGVIYHPDHGGDNPYPGILALSDELWTGSDSINMISEALATGKPVSVYPMPTGRRHKQFINHCLTHYRLSRVGQPDPGTRPQLRPVDGVAARLADKITTEWSDWLAGSP
ncbi:MAG: ELM1/GtrOC1 family putative glycosyltransferase [Wenzhouxiangellaceae bacterium]